MPAARTERRNRKCIGSQRGSQASNDSSLLADAPTAFSPNDKATTEVEEREQPQHGISILKEIFPDHETEKGSSGKHRPLQQLLGSLPSPARATLGSSQPSSNASVPFGPPAHAPTIPMAAPVGPPPPPLLPAPGCQAPQEQCEPPRAAAMMHPEQGFTSYRERLRAGGRGAFQRAYDAGFVPKNMKQEWGSAQTAHGGLPQQQQEMQHGYGASGDSQQMWNGAGQVQNNDYYGAPMQSQYQCMQQQVQQPQVMVQSMMLPQMAVQQPQMVPMPQDIGHTPMNQMQMPQMQVPQMPAQPLQLPQMAMSQCHTPTASGESTPTGWPLQQAVYGNLGTPTDSGASTPTEMARRECMAVLMPQTSQFFPCDQATLAAQLQASADCQRYED